MRQRLAPSLAIAFMSKVEAPVMDLRPLLYYHKYHHGELDKNDVAKSTGQSDQNAGVGSVWITLLLSDGQPTINWQAVWVASIHIAKTMSFINSYHCSPEEDDAQKYAE
ncbi:hypothetical protein KIN20_034226 [Parelaphostrongylus tenuis]|uniref:Uncharacterized protein n=1 Tax=Parelaphostrongylus tenuis TaxID=148309 RepID=A0AAD5R9C0_PARTN|nr:hypothetical protein KIN20_034226 [Parelaphostrongylus tenuis]